MNPKSLIDFIEKNKLGYLLGSALRYIVNANEAEGNERLLSLVSARELITIEIRRLRKGSKVRVKTS